MLDLCSRIFEKAGLEPEDALSVASLLVDAERRGINAVVGNNPFGVGLNGEKNKETAIDQACSISAKGRAVMMAKQGMEIPMGWFLDENGEPTNDLSKFSAMVPMAAHKGYGIAFGIEVLSGFLSGGALPQNMNSQADPKSCELANQFFAAVNISFFRDPADFKKSLDEYIDRIKLSKLKAGVDSVKYPGEIEHDASVRAEKEGIRIPDPVARDRIGHAVKFGLEPTDYAFLQ